MAATGEGEATMGSHALLRRGVGALLGLVLVAGAAVVGAGDASAGVSVQAAPSVTSVEMGQRVSVTGKIAPGKAGVTVVAEVKTGNGWRAVKSGKTGAGGAFTLNVLPTDPGAFEYRVAAKNRNRTTGASAPFTVVSLMWHYLADMRSVNGPAFNDSVRMNGATFAKSVTTYLYREPPEYDLRRACTRMVATAGIKDDAPSDSVRQLKVLADGAELFNGTFVLGQSAPIDVDLSDHLRLRLEIVVVKNSVDAGRFGDPRILCAFGKD